MTALLSTVLLLALTRAEIIERMRAPVITQADGLVKVFADCPEDMRREYQTPIARFAGDTVDTLYRSLGKRPQRFAKPALVIHVGDIRTNLSANAGFRPSDVTAAATTNGGRVVTRIWLKAPGYADLARFRTEVIKGFCRAVDNREITDAEAVRLYRRGDPRLRVIDGRRAREDWIAGRGGADDETGLRMLRHVYEPGRATCRDVLIFASRLFLYPPQRDVRLAARYECLSFREAVKLASRDPLTRVAAFHKAGDVTIAGGGRGAELQAAADAYREFLLAFARGDDDRQKLLELLDAADVKLAVAYEKAMAHTRELTGGVSPL